MDDNKYTSLSSIKIYIKTCKIEARNPRNDGWVQSGYLSRLEEIFNEAEKALLECRKSEYVTKK